MGVSSSSTSGANRASSGSQWMSSDKRFGSSREALIRFHPRRRARAAIVGAFVADAATMPLHLIYDQLAIESAINNRLDRLNGPEFLDPPATPFYNYEVGRQSPYGDLALPVLHSVCTRGYLDIDDVQQSIYEFCKSYDGRLNRVCRKFCDRRSNGQKWKNCASDDDSQFTSVAFLPIIVARYAGHPKLLEKVDEVVGVLQSNESVKVASRFAARLLEKVIIGHSIREAIAWAYDLDDLDPLERQFLVELDKCYYQYSPSLNSTNCMESVCFAKNPSQQPQQPVSVPSLTPTKLSRQVDPYCSTASNDSLTSLEESSNSSNSPKNDRINNKSDKSDNSNSNSHRNPTAVRRSQSSKASFTHNSMPLPFSLFAEQCGLSAHLPNSFLVALYALNCFQSYSSAVRANMTAGGENIVRSWFIGAMFAAEKGEEVIPETWKNKTQCYKDVFLMANRLAGSNSFFDSLQEKTCRLIPS